MRILAFSDWRVQSIDELIDYIKNMDKKPDLILYGGDDVKRFGSIPKNMINDEVKRIAKMNKYEYGFVVFESDYYPILLWMRNIHEEDAMKRIEIILKSYETKAEGGLLIPLLGNPKGSRLIPESFFLEYIARRLKIGKKYTIDKIIEKTEIDRIDEDIILAKFFIDRQTEDKNKFEQLASISKYGLFGILGNDCSKIHRHILIGEKIFDLHESAREIEDILFVGMEGAIEDAENPLGEILYKENEIKKHLNEQIRGRKNKIAVLLSHCPPKGILDTSMRYIEGANIGSLAIRNFIKKNNVILHVCGHCHFLGGKYQKFGKCTVLNISSHDSVEATGKIAIIEVNNKKVDMEIYELPPSNLQAIYEIGPHYSRVLEKAGIKTIREFVSLDSKEIFSRTNISLVKINKWLLHGQSLITNKIILLRSLDMENPVLIDIETNLTQTLIWMICIYDPVGNICKQFIAYKEKEEKKILEEFLNFAKSMKYRRLFCYSGTDFEKRVLISRILAHKLDVDNLPDIEDLLYKIRNILVTPLTTYKLKEFGSFLGFKWRHPDIEGYNAPALYEQFLESRDKKIMKRLEEYNQDDVLVLWYITQKIKKMLVNKYYTIEELVRL